MGHGAEFNAGRGAKFQRGKDFQPAVTSEQLGLMVGNSINALIEAIQSGNSARLTAYLKFSGRFHRYSRRNQQLIFEQCPQATRVASYATWKKQGFQVRKMEEGERGIRILRPIPPAGLRRADRGKRLAEREEKPGDEYKESEVGFITRTFRVGTVFDVTHLIPEDQVRVPTIFTDIEGDHQAVYDRLVQAVRANGIEHRESLETHGARGYSAGGLIVVRPDQPVGNRAAVTAHEWGHEILHKEQERRQLSSQVKECHAEATAFVVLSHYGVTIPYSADYLINWGNTPETLRKELDLVTYAASQIITKVDAFGKGEQQIDDGEL